MKLNRAAAWGVLIAVLSMGFGATLVEKVELGREHEQRDNVTQLCSSVAFSIEHQLARSLSATYALAAILRQYGEVRRFDTLAAEMVRTYGGIGSLQLAPGGVVSQIYPLAGNEQAIGHDLFADPLRRTEAMRAVETRQLTLAGPLELKQGGVAVVGRLPVFTGDPQHGERFWGFAIVMIRLPELLKASNMGLLEKGQYAYQLSRINSQTGKWEPFARSGGRLERPVEFTFEVPNGVWMLSVAPMVGWRLFSSLILEYAMAGLASLAIGAFICLILRQPETLRLEVARRTQELETANRRLESEIRDRIRAEEEAWRLNLELEERVAERTARLEIANRELESFSYSVSHDLRAPLRHIEGFGEIIAEEYAGVLDKRGMEFLARISSSCRRMKLLIDSLLELARLSRGELRQEPVDLTSMAREIAADFAQSEPGREVSFRVADGMEAMGDPNLLRIALENLLGNAWKYTRHSEAAEVEFGVTETEGKRVFFVRDNGAGFDMKYVGKLFGVFQRLHADYEFEGVGVGLVTVQRIIHRHGGEIRAEGERDKGATFYFTL